MRELQQDWHECRVIMSNIFSYHVIMSSLSASKDVTRCFYQLVAKQLMNETVIVEHEFLVLFCFTIMST